MRSLLPLALVAFLAAPAAAQDTIPAQTPIEQALSADITEQGFDHILGLVTEFLPPDLTIGAIPRQEIIDIFICQLDLLLDNLTIHTEVTSLYVEATPDGLDLVANITLSINDPSDPAIVEFDGCLNYVCFLYTDPAPVQLRMPLNMAMATDEAGDPYVDVTFGELQHNIEDAMAGAVHLTDCAIGDINEFFDTWLNFNVFDLVIAQFVGQINDAVDGALYGDPDDPDDNGLEGTLEDALRGLWLADSIDALDATLNYEINPTAVVHDDLGLRLVLGGRLWAEPAQCISGFDDPGSPWTDSPLPPMTETSPSGAGYHAAVLASDDFVNQAMYAAWRGGVLCFALDSLGSTALDTTYLGLLLGLDNSDRLEEVLEAPSTPMLIRTVPESQPLATFNGPNDIDITIEGLNIEFYPVIAERFARLAAVAIDVQAGINVAIAPDGALTLDIILDTDNLNPRVTYNEIAPDLDQAFEENFPSFLGVVIDTLAGSLLEGMAFALPTISGQGLTALGMEPVGPLGDWLGAYATLGESTGGEGDGCSDCGDGGCGDAGCGDAGCGADSGCGGEGGCDIESTLADAGCSGEASDLPDDTGCQGCKMVTTQVSSNRWRITIHPEGTSHRRGTGRIHVGVLPMLLVLAPGLFAWRRRRTSAEMASEPEAAA